MRTTPVVGSKVWFGPRRFGWGLEPVSPEGWAVTAATVLVSAVARTRRDPRQRLLAFLLALTFLAVTFLKGTSPGGRRDRATFEATRVNTDAI
jgi:hypothetical protein